MASPERARADAGAARDGDDRRILELEEELKRRNREIHKVRDELNTMARKHDDVRDRNNSLLCKVAVKTDKESRTDVLEGQVEELAEQARAGQQRCQEMEQRIERLASEAESQAAELERAEREREAFQPKLELLEACLNRTRQEAAEREAAVWRARAAMEESEARSEHIAEIYAEVTSALAGPDGDGAEAQPWSDVARARAVVEELERLRGRVEALEADVERERGRNQVLRRDEEAAAAQNLAALRARVAEARSQALSPALHSTEHASLTPGLAKWRTEYAERVRSRGSPVAA